MTTNGPIDIRKLTDRSTYRSVELFVHKQENFMDLIASQQTNRLSYLNSDATKNDDNRTTLIHTQRCQKVKTQFFLIIVK